MKLFSILVFSGAVLLSSCKHDPITAGNNPVPVDSLCFERDVLPIFQINCAKSGCHDDITAEEGFRATSYASIIKKIKPKSLSGSKIWEVIHDSGEDRMPPPPNPPLTADQVNTIKTWIMEGAFSDCK